MTWVIACNQAGRDYYFSNTDWPWSADIKNESVQMFKTKAEAEFVKSEIKVWKSFKLEVREIP